MKKITVFLLVACLFFSGCTSPRETGNNESDEITSPAGKNSIAIDCTSVEESERDMCYLNQSVSFNNPELCQKIQNPEVKELCDAAVTGNIPAYCDARVEKINDMYCQTGGQEHYCDNSETMQQNRNTCLEMGGLLLWDSELCELISDTDVKFKCLAVVEHDADYCEKIGFVLHKEDCYSRVASLTGDTELCEKIEDSARREGCILHSKDN